MEETDQSREMVVREVSNSSKVDTEEVYLSNKDMEEMGINIGGGIKIRIGPRRSRTAIVGNPTNEPDISSGVIRVNSHIMKSLGISPEDKVKVRSIDSPEAKNIEIDIQTDKRISANFGANQLNELVANKVKQKIQGRIVSRNTRLTSDNLSAFLPPQFNINMPIRIVVKVVDFEPKNSEHVKVSPRTSLTVSDSSQVSTSDERPPNPFDAMGGGGFPGMPPTGNQEESQIRVEEGEEEQMDIPDVGYEDIGGLEDEMEKAREMIEIPMKYPKIFEKAGIEPPKGLLLHGPPGTGKTLLARAIANEIDASFHNISGPEIMSKYYGQSEQKLRQLFEEAEQETPSIIFIDELDAIAPKRENAQGDMETRIVSQLLSLMDGLEARGDVVVIAATNRVDSVDTALRRGGRFDRELEIGVPDKKGRKEILQIHTRGMSVEDDFSPKEFSDRTQGFVGADLEALCKEAAMNAIRKLKPKLEFDEEGDLDDEVLQNLEVKVEDFEEALLDIEPSAMREVFVETPDITYENIGGLDDVKQNLKELVEWPMRHKNMFEHLDVDESSGILLYGPPGTGKTLLAKAISNESNANFISIKGPELLNKYVGESEKGIREVFKKARQNSPSIIFFDEIDSIASERGNSGDSQVTERVVSQLLTELDGVEDMEGVKVIAATNRPDLIDSALLRTGRLDKLVEVGFPDRETREEIFRIHMKNKPLGENVDVSKLSERTEGYTGSDIAAICREASMNAMRSEVLGKEEPLSEDKVEEVHVKLEDFEQAMDEVDKSITEEEKKKYQQMSEKVGRDEVSDVEEKGRMFR